MPTIPNGVNTEGAMNAPSSDISKLVDSLLNIEATVNKISVSFGAEDSDKKKKAAVTFGKTPTVNDMMKFTNNLGVAVPAGFVMLHNDLVKMGAGDEGGGGLSLDKSLAKLANAAAGFVENLTPVGLGVALGTGLAIAAIPLGLGLAAALVGAGAGLAVAFIGLGKGLGEALVGAGEALSTAFKGLGEGLASALTGLGELARGIGEGLGSVLKGALEGLGALGEGLGRGLGAVLSGLGDFAKGIGEGIGSALYGLMSGLGEFAKGIGEGLGAALEGLFSGLGEFAEGIGKGLGSILLGLFSGIGELAKGIGEGLGSALKGLLSGVADIAEGIGKGLGAVMGATAEGIGKGVGAVIKGTGDAIKGIGEGVGSVLKGTGDAAEGIGKGIGSTLSGAGDLAKGIGEGLAAVVFAGGDAIGAIAKGIGEGVAEAFRGGGDAIATIIKAMKSNAAIDAIFNDEESNNAIANDSEVFDIKKKGTESVLKAYFASLVDSFGYEIKESDVQSGNLDKIKKKSGFGEWLKGIVSDVGGALGGLISGVFSGGKGSTGEVDVTGGLNPYEDSRVKEALYAGNAGVLTAYYNQMIEAIEDVPTGRNSDMRSYATSAMQKAFESMGLKTAETIQSSTQVIQSSFDDSNIRIAINNLNNTVSEITVKLDKVIEKEPVIVNAGGGQRTNPVNLSTDIPS